MSMLQRMTSFQLGGSSGIPDTNSKPTAYGRPVKGKSLQTSSLEPPGRNTASLKYNQVAPQGVNRLTRQPRAAQPQIEPGRAGKCRNSPHQMKMSITARKTIKTISDDISCERTQKKRKLSALLVDQRRQEKVSRSNGKLKETSASQTSASHGWSQQHLRPPSPSLMDPSTSWTIRSLSTGDIGQNSENPALMGSGAQFQPIPANAGRVPSGQWQPGKPIPIKDIGASWYHDSRRNFWQLDGAEDEISEKPACPYPGCGGHFRDMKAHMLTHQNDRPEKCPIETCEYHKKGFARKYDKNRHTLTHLKGSLVCGFCLGGWIKSFYRADVFKRHLISVHGVEQTLPKNRKRQILGSTGVTNHLSGILGKCSTCTRRFSSAQSFYEHLDDCVLRRVAQQYSIVEASMEEID